MSRKFFLIAFIGLCAIGLSLLGYRIVSNKAHENAQRQAIIHKAEKIVQNVQTLKTKDGQLLFGPNTTLSIDTKAITYDAAQSRLTYSVTFSAYRGWDLWVDELEVAVIIADALEIKGVKEVAIFVDPDSNLKAAYSNITYVYNQPPKNLLSSSLWKQAKDVIHH